MPSRMLLREMDAAGFRRMAGAYLRENPELVEQAAELVRKDPELRQITERDARRGA
jgi:hypothetical protein